MRVCDRCDGTKNVQTVLAVAAAMKSDYSPDLARTPFRRGLFNAVGKDPSSGMEQVEYGPPLDLCENCFDRLRSLVTSFCEEKEPKQKMHSYPYECVECGKGVHATSGGYCADCYQEPSSK